MAAQNDLTIDDYEQRFREIFDGEQPLDPTDIIRRFADFARVPFRHDGQQTQSDTVDVEISATVDCKCAVMVGRGAFIEINGGE